MITQEEHIQPDRRQRLQNQNMRLLGIRAFNQGIDVGDDGFEDGDGGTETEDLAGHGHGAH